MPTIESNGISLSYEDTGSDGRPVVLIHGWPLRGASWSGQIPALAGYRVITYDRRGFGDSDKPETGYDYDTLAADLAGLMDGLDLHDASLVGFSMGGGEVARYLSAYGDSRVRSAVFACSVPPYLLKTDDNPEGGLDDATVEGMKQGAGTDREGFFGEFFKSFFGADGEVKATDAQIEEAMEMMRPARDEAVVACIDSFGRTDFRDDLTTISVPTLVLHGDQDATVPFEVSGRRTAATVAGAELVVIEGGTHGFNVTHVEEFNQALLDFLAK